MWRFWWGDVRCQVTRRERCSPPIDEQNLLVISHQHSMNVTKICLNVLYAPSGYERYVNSVRRSPIVVKINCRAHLSDPPPPLHFFLTRYPTDISLNLECFTNKPSCTITNQTNDNLHANNRAHYHVHPVDRRPHTFVFEVIHTPTSVSLLSWYVTNVTAVSAISIQTPQTERKLDRVCVCNYFE